MVVNSKTNRAGRNAAALKDKSPHFDVFVCRGRMCTSAGADRLFVELGRAVHHADDTRVQLRRGGCYGLCDLSPNVVVRRYAVEAREDDDTDLLTLTGADNESAYCKLSIEEAAALVSAHLDHDAAYSPALRERRERAHPPKTEVEARLRQLRAQRRASQEGTPLRNEAED